MNNDGGPAFPFNYGGFGQNQGMTLRDYFAAQALSGMLAYSNVNHQNGNWVENCTEKGVADMAYSYADAMIEARLVSEDDEDD